MPSIGLLGCADPRVQETLTEIYDAIAGRYGAPYRQTQYGAELYIALEETSAGILRAMSAALSQPLTCYVVVGHTGGSDDAGCAAYQYEYGRPGSPIQFTAERALHWRNMALTRRYIRQSADQYGQDPEVVTILDHHGSLELVSASIGPPTVVKTLSVRDLLDLIADLYPAIRPHSMHPAGRAAGCIIFYSFMIPILF